MGHLIDSVAELTDLRDRDALEATLAAVTLELIQASRLTLWKVIYRAGVVRLRQRVNLVARGAPEVDEAPIDPNMLLPLVFRPDLYDCFHAGTPLCRKATAEGDVRYVFPVMDGRNVIRLLEILRSSPLREDQERLIVGMLRIYSNHLGVLDYGDCDELTGLFNRRTFHDYFSQIASYSDAVPPRVDERVPTRERFPHLAVIDIDFFKRINDDFGHPFGDEVLVLFARLMRECFNDLDRLFRFGGEEFLVILNNATKREAQAALENFRATVEGFRFPQVGPVTASIGYTTVLPGDTGSSAFGRADAALYVAKQRGRNQVRSHEMLIADGVIEKRKAVGQDVELF
ncbi:GGDEF domain-containing protein [Methylocystis sp. WRRC1]|uniref:GGDEF domain-containing protein n=1 Tax=Methylocystis sp. WRRC1 TaxID=1732014 RepID=UPI001D149BDC|nr:GGDEF domain-containing protein [Methylocystis sp. WRRC1]MCC3244785.1 GGDEF domain-containing protein [Methylocystis sp. WRRC1]